MLEPVDKEQTETEDESNLLVSEKQIYDFKSNEMKYKEILHDSVVKVRIVIFVSLSVSFAGTTRYYIMETYLKSISSLSTLSVSSIIFGGFIWYALVTFIATILGDKHGHDRILSISYILCTIGIFLESITRNIIIFSMGYFINRVAILSVSTAYIAYILPHKYSILYIAKLFTFSSIVYLIGPLISGFVVDYFNYRLVFWINFVVILFFTLIVIIFIHGSQNKLQNKQKILSKMYVMKQEENDRFPICKYIDDEDDVSWKSFFEEIEKYSLIILILSLIQNCLCWAMEGIFIFYFALFIMNRFNISSLLYISSMLTVITILFGVVTILIPKLISRIIPKYIYIITISSSLSSIICILCIFKWNTLLLFNSTFLPIYAISFGVTLITTEMCILEIQPKKHSGKVSGTKYSLRIILRACGILIVGAFWFEPYCNAFWFVNATISAIIAILTLPMFYFIPFMKHNISNNT